MSETKQFVDLDPKQFKLSEYDNVHITMPRRPSLSEEDIDAQLFEYVISGGKKIQSLADLDDDWVKDNFEGMETIADVRQAIIDQYDHDMEFAESDIKFHNCIDALIARLEGEIPQELIDSNTEAMLQGNEQRLKEMHLTMDQYLREEHLTFEQYEEKTREETLTQMRSNVALDIMADVLGTQVGNHEICDYLSTPNPQKFLEEIRENGQVEAARKAAVRVKVMRRVVETAVMTYEDGSAYEKPKAKTKSVPKPVAKPVVEEEDEDFEMPNMENLPPRKIRDDMPDIYTFELIDK